MWTIEPGHSGTKFCVKSEERDEHGPYTEVIAMVHAPDNAQLIAAAPDLLEALESCLLDLQAANPKCVRLTSYRAALAKAKGDA